ncbi:MAG TPA: L-threonylcarbamoyladenylate synthase [Jiangellaceae bacterium]|nr:L-threonylcarbamoyladenylate synthase [Jiangellaceae bacterium]
MSTTYDCNDPDQRRRGVAAAIRAVRRGALVVLPTDTVYGLGCDAFSPEAVTALLAAKGRGRNVPVPVLVGSLSTLSGVSAQTGGVVSDLVEAFWPGGLTLVCRQQPSLHWDLGDAGGTVAVRMPLHPVAIEVLRETGPMAVSSANRSGQPPARSGGQARDQLGEAVAVYLDSDPTDDDVPSTIVDVTGPVPRVLRAGAVSLELLREVAPTTVSAESSP